MANTLTNMQSRIFADSAVREFNSILTPLNAFSTSLNAESARKGDVIRVPVFPTVTAGAFAGSYSAADSTIVGVDVTLNQHYFKSVAFTDREVAESDTNYFENMGVQCGKAVAKQVVLSAFGLVTAANFLNTAADKLVAATISLAGVASIVKLLADKGIDAGSASLVLNSTQYTTLLQDSALKADAFGGSEAIRSGKIPTLLGLNGIYMSPILPVNAENLAGFACAKQAMAIGMRYLAPQSTEGLIDSGSVTDDESGVVLGVRVIPEPLAGKVHYVVEALWGNAKVDGKSLVRHVTA